VRRPQSARGGGGCSEGRSDVGTTEIIALLAVLGTLVGTLGGAVLNHFLAKQKEDDARKRETKQEVYEEYAALALLPDRFFDADQHPEQYARALARMDLYGAPKVRRPARRMFDLELERNKKQRGSDEYERVNTRLEVARREYIAAAREELGYSHD
jgi:hypothetical protein